jgi:BON domain-containing protein
MGAKSRWRASGLLAVGSALAAAAATYLLDPIAGRRRRALLRDRSAALSRDIGQGLARWSQLRGGQLEGMLQRASHAGDADVMPNDAALVAKVESELFRDPALPKGLLNVNAEKGVVVLRGELAAQEQIDDLIRRAGRIAGVRRVESLLHPAGTPAPAETRETASIGTRTATRM